MNRIWINFVIGIVCIFYPILSKSSAMGILVDFIAGFFNIILWAWFYVEDNKQTKLM